MPTKEKVNILWFRNGLRLHDNESLLKATKDKSSKLLPLFIFDGETPTTKHCKYNKMAFLLECLEDLDTQFWYHGGKLNLVEGDPVEVLRKISKHYAISKLCFDQDCEPIWLERDNAVKNFCGTHKIKVEESIGATLWDPLEIIAANGGSPPLTYSQFSHVTKGIGPPRRPMPDVDFSRVQFAKLESFGTLLRSLAVFPTTPTPSMLGIKNSSQSEKLYAGGEQRALKYFDSRMREERKSSFSRKFSKPNLAKCSKSLSPYIKFGCLSVNKFYWALQDGWSQFNKEASPGGSYSIISHLIWREFYYAMSANNPFYGEMERNPICINLPWNDNEKDLNLFLAGKTGFPFIDAGIRQLKKEGWIHHIMRNTLAMFLTRGDLWLSWEHGLKFFMSYSLDADWSVCAGNWMWVSSSAFEKSLDSTLKLDPTTYGQTVDQDGLYIRKYIPELKHFPAKFIYEPWNAPAAVQSAAGCVIGTDYPRPMVDHSMVAERNQQWMEKEQKLLLQRCNMKQPEHVKPSDESEINVFFGF
eukprot:TRINITY_DN23945_c0_g1_i1.p1 TRINITY_DN23945_c0_g1~~TRINITY_DN23945_c0_g1_i1.p1  ORF type:complete len:557 (-),score=96.24 TRINITY_DN23945_c0_g1_i1:131-1714(-)